jgi:hypothetical protein
MILILDCHLTIHADCLEMSDFSPCTFLFSEERVSMSFFKVFTSLMRNYRAFFKPNRVIDDQVDGLQSYGFKPEEFIADFDSESRV